ncbi:hypothetical protein HYH02_013564 [Chlamydomonas schloesseri]|uniref:Methyltransferase domain-containing protein n=1 Tax=Chlamydomonas schloesseri TaxID=2026947 RepID=A0A835VVC8_9CHLO|nr:hypothetical protein HYH02_013564 [Chlamydomonas schloesseri]|eukprot:KAG2430722.1 hypothetical protein HYH02_013564 [Chlamydomonas schloesseri]
MGSVRTAATVSTSEASTSGSSSWLPARPRRVVVQRGSQPSSINWDRWELMMYARMEAAEKEGSTDEGEESAAQDGSAAAGASTSSSGSASAASFSGRLAASDLTAAYFRRWDDPAAHQPALQDRLLTSAWREALTPGSLEGKTVLDVGCGLGLLSLMAAKAGAARVIAVDGSAGACDSARRIVRANGLEDRITVVHGAIESLRELPGLGAGGKVDVVLSGWMGAGLLAGGMINGVAHAVQTWLKPGGMVLPDRVSLWAAALEDRDALLEAKESWSRVSGFDMSAALAQAIKHPRRDVLTRKSQLLSAPQRLAEWRTAELRPDAVLDAATGAYARCPIQLTAVREERLFGLVMWWDATWTLGGALEGEGKSPVRFTTHPLSSASHYQQLMLDFPKSVRLAADDVVGGELVLRPGTTDPRDLEVSLEVAAAGTGITGSYRISHLPVASA